jgi:hypothetical protein
MSANPRRFPRRRALAAAALIGLAPACALASSFPVNNCDDSASAINTNGTLRYAIANASSGDTIDLSAVPAFTSSCPNSTITLQSGQFVVSQKSLILKGSTVSPVTITTRDKGIDSSRVFKHVAGIDGSLEFDYLTIKNGKYLDEQARGGCIYSQGSVVLNHSTVTGCTAKQAQGTKTNALTAGGAIYASVNVVLLHSTVTGNAADASGDSNSYAARGGGVYAHNNLVAQYSTIDGNQAIPSPRTHASVAGGAFVIGNVSITNSTISNNYGQQVGGLYQSFGNPGYSVIIENSTFSGNSGSTTLRGIGALQISQTPAVSILNSTIAANSGYFGGVWSNANITLQSSIVADNVGQMPDLYLGTFATISGSHNLVASTNLKSPPAGVITLTQNPKLAPLANHGGPTLTHALLPGSPAVGAGSNSGAHPFQYDQRGTGFFRTIVPAPLASVTDIGAYQRQLVDDEVFYDGFAPLPGN